jgi:ferredoxin
MAEDMTKDKALKIDYTPPEKSWMESRVEIRKGAFCYPVAPKNEKYLDLPHPREWQPTEQDWKLPENWKEILLKGMEERLGQYRSYQLFLDICVRCGACADKCHFFIGSGDPKTCRFSGRKSCDRSIANTSPPLGKYLGPLPVRENLRKRW